MIAKGDIENNLNELRGYRQRHQDLAKKMLEAYGGHIYPLDIFALANLHRSINLLFGFFDLINNRNAISATPLIRLQIDNCARFFASFIVENPHEFAMSIIKGEQINKMKDQRGNLMNDAYLINKLSNENPWIKRVYKETSGWVHLSDKHIFSTFRIDVGNTLEGRIGLEDQFVPDSLYIEEIAAFKASTELLFKYVSGWVYTKDNPHSVQKAKEEYTKNHGFPPNY